MRMTACARIRQPSAAAIAANPTNAHIGNDSPRIGGYGVSHNPLTLKTSGSQCAGGRLSTTGCNASKPQLNPG